MLWPQWRLARERRTVAAMIAIYCRDRHGGRGLCDACIALHRYARQRLYHCVYGAAKPTCLNCSIHCYRREAREGIRKVMAYAGPRMLARHPVLTLFHLLDGRRTTPRRPARAPAAGVARNA
jgi:hypothetical protein